MRKLPHLKHCHLPSRTTPSISKAALVTGPDLNDDSPSADTSTKKGDKDVHAKSSIKGKNKKVPKSLGVSPVVKEQIVITDDQIIFPGEELDKPVIPPDPKGKLLTMLRSGIPQVSSPIRLGLLGIQIPTICYGDAVFV